MAKTISTTKSAPLVKAYARELHIAPRKMRLVTNMVKDMNVGLALTQLTHTNKKGAPMLVKLLKSAVANAQHNFSLDPERLYIKEITTDMGRVMKRYFPRARGSAFVIRRKLSHVNGILEERGSGKKVAGRFNFLKKKSTEEKPGQGAVPEVAKEKTEKEEPKKQKTFKTEEQVKMNKVQNKRRLFNRKSGE
jgi:large subunit ribosomal protein L22